MKFQSREKVTFFDRARQFLWPRRGFKRAWTYLLYRMARMKASPHKLALGFAIGAFASFTPLLGLHIILAALLAFLLRANVIASAIGTALGNPITLPLIWVASYDLGTWLLGREASAALPLDSVMGGGAASPWNLTQLFDFRDAWVAIAPYLWPLLVGSLLLGAVFASLSYVVVRRAVLQIQQTRHGARA